LDSAAYFRARAERFLKLASLMSDASITNTLLIQAAELHTRALELEANDTAPKSGPKSPSTDHG
jgi:hypothetical protein